MGDEAELRRHFLKFGKVDTIDLLSNQRAKIIFKKRNEAEKALINGKQFKSESIKLRFLEIEDLNQLSFENNDNDNDGEQNQNENRDDKDGDDVIEQRNGNAKDLKVYDDLPQITKNGNKNGKQKNDVINVIQIEDEK